MKKHSFIIIATFFVIVALSMIQVIVSNRLSTEGILVGKIEDEMQFYKVENASLSEALLFASSVTNIARRASQKGFVSQDSYFVLSKTLPLALRQ